MARHGPNLQFSAYVPKAPLCDYVEILWIYEGYSVPHMQERLLPGGRMELVIGLDPDDRIGMGLTGVHSRFMVLDTSFTFSIIGAHFRAGGAFPFFDTPAGEFQDLGVSLEEVWGRFAKDVRDQLLQATNREARFRILERALLEKGKGRLDRRHRAVEHALKMFGRHEFPVSVADVTEQTGLSARRFIEVFRDEVGLTPKLYSRIQRFQNAIHTLYTVEDPDLVDVAMSCGYFDQAHFIHDFREFSGLNPSAYLRQRTPHLNHVPILD
jgi:AraC-like DNA-binding protein